MQRFTSLKKTVTVIALLFVLPATATEQIPTVTFSSGTQQVTLLELYTSEGCNSCPPADRWLSQLRDSDRLWTQIVPVGLHVDYWNYIGWTDRFSDARFTKRQRDYVRNGAANVVYTPGFFSNGGEWRDWRRNRLPANPQRPVGELRAVVERNSAAIEFSPAANVDSPLLATVAILGMGLETEVRAGENKGRTLKHDFVALSLQSVPMKRIKGSYVADLALPDLSGDSDDLAIAVWVTPTNGVRPIQSTGGYL